MWSVRAPRSSWKSIPLALFGHEQAVFARVRARHECFLADGFEGAVAVLQAEGAEPRTPGLVGEFQAAFGAVIEEAGAGFGALELGVLVVAVGHAGAHAAEDAEGLVDARLGFQAALFHVDGDRGFTRCGIAGFTGVAVLVFVAGCGHAEEAGVAHQRRAERTGAGVDETVGLAAERGFVVVLVAIHAVRMDHERAIGAHGIGARHPGPALVDAVVARFRAAAHGFGHGLFGDAAIDRIHHAADGAAAIKQGCRALEHLDLVGEKRLDRNVVVLADRGNVGAVHSAGQRGDPGIVQAADDRTADALAEIGALHAGQLADRFAEGGALGLIEFVASQDFDGLGHVFRAGPQGVGRHHDLVEVGRVFVAGVVAGVGGRGGNGPGQRQGEGERKGREANRGGGGHSCLGGIQHGSVIL